ncbi:putative serine protease K12H4.7 [Anopheles moucheti]|uniref:putative serine protease K12H4.7 n=1 Tax=Anopheles moucheti TaxID=186751 RepID=UPI0022F09268|nr:putative serine protease K12H4.7 [Anopheles moucheti]
MKLSSASVRVAALLLLGVIVVASGKSVEKIRRPFPGIERIVARKQGMVPPKGYVSQNPRTVEGRFTSRVNHFDPQNRDTFEFNYLHNDQYYRQGGPLFIVLGGHYPINPYFMENSHFRDVAALQGAWLATNEHRYFGDSNPVPDYSTENLRFMRTEQVLFDLIEWIDFLRREVVGDPNARVILHGFGYAGSLATWARQRFPNIIDGAWGSSAPVRATANFEEFAEEVGIIIRNRAGAQCYNRIFQAFHTAQNLIDAGVTELISEMFNTCDPVDTTQPLEIELFFYAMMLSLEAAMVEDLDADNINRVCDVITDEQYDTGLEGLANFLVERYSDARECFDLSLENFVQYLTDPAIDAPANVQFGLRQATYQDCTEFGYFETTSSPNQPFGNRVTYDLFLAECQAGYGDFLTQEVVYEGIRLTNFHFGSTDPRTTNVLFTSAEIDPLRAVSITEYTNLLANARVTPGAFITQDIMSISGLDSEELLETKHMAEQYISTWLGSPISPFRK